MLSGAEVAEAIDEELVPSGTKAGGKIGLQLNAAACKLKKFTALIALKMMVMVLAGDLVASSVSGDDDGDQPAFFEQLMNGAINGGNREAENSLLGESERLFVGEGTIGCQESGANGFFLPGIAKLHGHLRVLEVQFRGRRGPGSTQEQKAAAPIRLWAV